MDETISVRVGAFFLRLDRSDTVQSSEDWWMIGERDPDTHAHARWYMWVSLAHAIIERDIRKRVDGHTNNGG